ncbi:hypothetical protein GPALN_015566 [Globodera pallida]|nr:hypothetical protein GPALN_015566 [Globodera pallida]
MPCEDDEASVDAKDVVKTPEEAYGYSLVNCLIYPATAGETRENLGCCSSIATETGGLNVLGIGRSCNLGGLMGQQSLLLLVIRCQTTFFFKERYRQLYCGQ